MFYINSYAHTHCQQPRRRRVQTQLQEHMHGGNIGIAAFVSLHDCPCEWRQRHMASGERYLATLQMPLCRNVTPTWLITHHLPRPPPHFHISLFSPVPHFGSSPSFSLLLFPPPHMLCFVPSFSLSSVISVIRYRTLFCGEPLRQHAEKWMPSLHHTRCVWRYTVLKFSSVENTCSHRGLMGIMLQQSICKYA